MAEDNFHRRDRKHCTLVPDGGLILGQTDGLTVVRKITSSLTFRVCSKDRQLEITSKDGEDQRDTSRETKEIEEKS
jgi:hypothetical protein